MNETHMISLQDKSPETVTYRIHKEIQNFTVVCGFLIIFLTPGPP